jgi:hypothetical protein
MVDHDDVPREHGHRCAAGSPEIVCGIEVLHY